MSLIKYLNGALWLRDLKVKSFSMHSLTTVSSPRSSSTSTSHTGLSQIRRMYIMADSTLRVTFPLTFPMMPRRSSYPILHSLSPKPPIFNLRLHSSPLRLPKFTSHVSSVQEAVGSAVSLIQSSPPTWESALASNLLIFLLGSPILVSGLSLSGIAVAFLLGTLTWRAFGSSGFLLVAAYFIIGTAVTKVKMVQKEAEGIAEKRKGRRGPGSVVGSSAAGCLCAFLSIYGFGGEAFSQLWLLGFVASFCTKLSDTVSSEIGKAYGKTTYLVTTFKIVPRGTEGAVSVEGTLAGILASIVLAFLSCLLGKINTHEAAICALASQIANLGESFLGAALQGKKGFQWLTNDVANVINILTGSVVAILLQLALLKLNM